MTRDHLLGVAQHPALAAEHDEFAQRKVRPFALGYPDARLNREEDARYDVAWRRLFGFNAFERGDHGKLEGITEADCRQGFAGDLAELERKIAALSAPDAIDDIADIKLAVADALGRGIAGSAIREMMVAGYGKTRVRDIHRDRWPALLRDLCAMQKEGGI